jgi:hypothetical protein
MTALTSHQASATSVDRVLLHAASALDQFVAQRMERRAATSPSAGLQHDDSRTTAQALGAIGILPR